MICTTYFLTFFSELIPPTGKILFIFRLARFSFYEKQAGRSVFFRRRDRAITLSGRNNNRHNINVVNTFFFMLLLHFYLF